MGSHQQFCLRWNNHQTNLLNVFEELLEQETLVDVTLACEGLSLKAHKVVLSACSPYFQTLFANNPCKHPIVILKDVKYVELKNVVDFMYKGEINVVHDQLDALLKVADTLQVKGLAEVTENFSLNRERLALSENDSNVESQKSTKKVGRGSQNISSQSSGPACKRRRRHRGGSGISNGETVEDAQKQNSVTRLEYPLPVKAENTSDIYENHRSSSNAESARPCRTSKKANNVHLIEAENEIDSDLNIPFTNENVSVELTNPPASTSSVAESNLINEDDDLLDEELSRSIFYPSTSAGDDLNSAISKETVENDRNRLEERWMCKQCGREYDVYTSYCRHVRQSVCSGSFFTCDLCRKVFSRKDSLKRHWLIAHKSEDQEEERKDANEEFG